MIPIILIIRMDTGRQTWSLNQQDLRINIWGREVTVLWRETVNYLIDKTYSLPLQLLCLLHCVKIDGETLLKKLLSGAVRGSAWIWSKFQQRISNGNQQESPFTIIDNNMAVVNEDDAIIGIDTDDVSHDQTSMMMTVSNNIRF